MPNEKQKKKLKYWNITKFKTYLSLFALISKIFLKRLVVAKTIQKFAYHWNQKQKINLISLKINNVFIVIQIEFVNYEKHLLRINKYQSYRNDTIDWWRISIVEKIRFVLNAFEKFQIWEVIDEELYESKKLL